MTAPVTTPSTYVSPIQRIGARARRSARKIVEDDMFIAGDLGATWDNFSEAGLEKAGSDQRSTNLGPARNTQRGER